MSTVKTKTGGKKLKRQEMNAKLHAARFVMTKACRMNLAFLCHPETIYGFYSIKQPGNIDQKNEVTTNRQ
jgi:hypothetical protein